MKVSELIEMLQNCYEDAEVVLDIPNYSKPLEVSSVDFDDSENIAYISI